MAYFHKLHNILLLCNFATVYITVLLAGILKRLKITLLGLGVRVFIIKHIINKLYYKIHFIIKCIHLVNKNLKSVNLSLLIIAVNKIQDN